MAPGESRAKKGNQATHSRITWFREEHNLYGDCCNLGKCLHSYSPVFSARSCKKRQDVCNVTELQRLELGCVATVDSNGRTIWIADAHRDNGKRFVVRADKKLTAFAELELAIRAVTLEKVTS
jgi:hypothetical protein